MVEELQGLPANINLNDNTVTYHAGDTKVVVKINPMFDHELLNKQLDKLKQMHLEDIKSQPGSTLDYCL